MSTSTGARGSERICFFPSVSLSWVESLNGHRFRWDKPGGYTLRTGCVRVQNLFVLAFVCLISLEGRAQAPPQKPAAKPPVVRAPEAVPAPTSKHYPILIIAHGTDPFWSLRLGMKGPERLDRGGYPPPVAGTGGGNPREAGGSWRA